MTHYWKWQLNLHPDLLTVTLGDNFIHLVQQQDILWQ
jgi:hypothetical protein